MSISVLACLSILSTIAHMQLCWQESVSHLLTGWRRLAASQVSPTHIVLNNEGVSYALATDQREDY